MHCFLTVGDNMAWNAPINQILVICNCSEICFSVQDATEDIYFIAVKCADVPMIPAWF